MGCCCSSSDSTSLIRVVAVPNVLGICSMNFEQEDFSPGFQRFDFSMTAKILAGSPSTPQQVNAPTGKNPKRSNTKPFLTWRTIS